MAAAAFLGGQSRLKAAPRGDPGAELPALQLQTDPLPRVQNVVLVCNAPHTAGQYRFRYLLGGSGWITAAVGPVITVQ